MGKHRAYITTYACGIMVNVFGNESVRGRDGARGPPGMQGNTGPAGPAGPAGSRGPRGEDGSIKDLCTWMPNTLLKNLQKNEEEACFFITDVNKDIVRSGDDIKQWTSRNRRTHLNLVADKPSKKLSTLSNGRHALVFNGASRYTNDDIDLLANHSGSHGFVCITFYVSEIAEHEEQTLLSNWDGDDSNINDWHEISITKAGINIWGIENEKVKCVTIPHTIHKKWTTLFIEQVTTRKQMQGRYVINNDSKLSGSFTFDRYLGMYTGCNVGSRDDDTRFFKGEIASIEMYHGEGKSYIPQTVKDLIIKNQLIKSSDESPPVKKNIFF